MRPIPGWRRAWRLWSVQIAGAGAAAMALIAALPADLIAAATIAFPNIPPLVTALLLGAVLIARLIEQPKERDDDHRD